MANPSVSTAPAHEPLTLDEVKAHLHLELTDLDQDAWLWGAIRAARTECENWTRRKLVTQTLSYVIPSFPVHDDYIVLPGGVLQSITSVTYTDKDNSDTVWASSNYFALTHKEPGWLVRDYDSTWPTFTEKPYSGVAIVYVVGYGTGDLVPDPLRQGMLLHIGALFENRESDVVMPGVVAVSVPHSAERLWWPYRILK